MAFVQALHHGGFDRQRVHFHVFDQAGRAQALLQAAKVEHPLHAQFVDALNVTRAQRPQVVGTKQPAPTQRPVFQTEVTPQVTKVAGTVKGEGAAGFLHGDP